MSSPLACDYFLETKRKCAYPRHLHLSIWFQDVHCNRDVSGLLTQYITCVSLYHVWTTSLKSKKRRERNRHSVLKFHPRPSSFHPRPSSFQVGLSPRGRPGHRLRSHEAGQAKPCHGAATSGEINGSKNNMFGVCSQGVLTAIVLSGTSQSEI